MCWNFPWVWKIEQEEGASGRRRRSDRGGEEAWNAWSELFK